MSQEGDSYVGCYAKHGPPVVRRGPVACRQTQRSSPDPVGIVDAPHASTPLLAASSRCRTSRDDDFNRSEITRGFRSRYPFEPRSIAWTVSIAVGRARVHIPSQEGVPVPAWAISCTTHCYRNRETPNPTWTPGGTLVPAVVDRRTACAPSLSGSLIENQEREQER